MNPGDFRDYEEKYAKAQRSQKHFDLLNMIMLLSSMFLAIIISSLNMFYKWRCDFTGMIKPGQGDSAYWWNSVFFLGHSFMICCLWSGKFIFQQFDDCLSPIKKSKYYLFDSAVSAAFERLGFTMSRDIDKDNLAKFLRSDYPSLFLSIAALCASGFFECHIINAQQRNSLTPSILGAGYCLGYFLLVSLKLRIEVLNNQLRKHVDETRKGEFGR